MASQENTAMALDDFNRAVQLNPSFYQAYAETAP